MVWVLMAYNNRTSTGFIAAVLTKVSNVHFTVSESTDHKKPRDTACVGAGRIIPGFSEVIMCQ